MSVTASDYAYRWVWITCPLCLKKRMENRNCRGTDILRERCPKCEDEWRAKLIQALNEN